MSGLHIARRRMRNSRLTGTGFDAPAEAVRWHGAVQGQDYGPAKWSIAQRCTSLVDGDLDRALEAGSIVRTHVLRPTWHLVAGEDIRWLLTLTGPRVYQHNRRRYRELELDEPTLARCEKLIASALEGGNRLTRDQLAGVLDDARIDRAGQRMPYILMHCELEAAICSGGLVGKQQTYALLDERVPSDGRFDGDDSLVELTRRYLTSHGPATVQDLRWWSSLTVADIKKALHMLALEVRSESLNDVTYWSMASDVSPPPVLGVHLLQTWDEFIVGYTESRFVGDPRAAAARAAWKDRSLPTGVVLLNGGVCGHWRRTIEKDSVRVEVVTYEDLKPSDSGAVEAAAEELGSFLGRRVNLSAKTLD